MSPLTQRALVIQIGLSEKEADSFLDRIAEEFAEGRLEAEAPRRDMCEQRGSNSSKQPAHCSTAPGIAQWQRQAHHTGITTCDTLGALARNTLGRW